jgi:hypothetical protein
VKRKNAERFSKEPDIRQAYEGSCVYALHDDGKDCVKVGKTTNLRTRLREFINYTSSEIRLLGAIFIEDKDRLGELETAVLQTLHVHAQHIKGEWFYANEDILRAVATECCEALSITVKKKIGIFLPQEKSSHDGERAWQLPGRPVGGRGTSNVIQKKSFW